MPEAQEKQRRVWSRGGWNKPTPLTPQERRAKAERNKEYVDIAEIVNSDAWQTILDQKDEYLSSLAQTGLPTKTDQLIGYLTSSIIRDAVEGFLKALETKASLAPNLDVIEGE